METKICCTCKIEKNIEEFSWKNKTKRTVSRECKVCHKQFNRSWYLINKDRLIGKYSKRNKLVRQEANTFLRQYLSIHPCVDCGNNDIRVLEFDHLYDKINSINHMRNHGLRKLKEEIKKCEVRCANCHRIKTYERNPCWRNIGV